MIQQQLWNELFANNYFAIVLFCLLYFKVYVQTYVSNYVNIQFKQHVVCLKQTEPTTIHIRVWSYMYLCWDPAGIWADMRKSRQCLGRQAMCCSADLLFVPPRLPRPAAVCLYSLDSVGRWPPCIPLRRATSKPSQPEPVAIPWKTAFPETQLPSHEPLSRLAVPSKCNVM